jgi:hypothetical protein
VHDARLNPGVGVDRSDRVGEPGQAVDAGDQDVFDAALVQVVEDRQPELGALLAGVRLGRPLSLSADVREAIRAEREAGRSFAAIANRLNAEHVPTAHGGEQWWPASVRSAIQSAAV